MAVGSDREDRERLRVRFLSAGAKEFIRKYVLSAAFRLLSIAGYILEPLLPRRFICLDRPIFIIGCSRSGTTLVLDMLRAHPDLADWSEAGQLFELRYYDPSCDHVKEAAEATAFERRRLRFALGLFTRLRGRSRFLNKHPQNSLRLGLIKAVFPDALFVHLVRDGRAVIASNVTQVSKSELRRATPFGNFPKPPDWRRYLELPLHLQFAHQWVDLTRYVQAFAARNLSPEDYREIRYEDFCRQPHGVLAELDGFLGLDHLRRDMSGVPSDFAATRGSWTRTFNEAERAAVLSVAAPLLAELGYMGAGDTPLSREATA